MMRFSTACTHALRSIILPPGAFRIVLAAAVVFSHLTRFDVGRLAVLVFFYLSGYWTSKIWNEKFRGEAAPRFYASRYLRIAPLYLLAVIVAAWALGLALHPENLTLLGVATTLRDPIVVAWSLDVELQFYLLLPFVVALLARATMTQGVVVALLIGIAGCLLEYRYGVVTVAKYFPAFAFGTMTHIRAWKPSARAAYVSLCAFAVVTAATFATPFIDRTSPDPFDRDIYGFFWMLPLIPYVARSLTIPSTRLDRHLGNLSYPLYLVHAPIINLAKAYVPWMMLTKIAAAALAGLVATALYVFIDRPVDRWRVRWTEGKQGVAPAD
jgi:peptidoglycan/LPS O-acetylase OafA/YrhL